jgi:hypothetical protein
MKNKNYEWTENKLSNVSSTIGVWIFILAFSSSIISLIFAEIFDFDPLISMAVLFGGWVLSIPFLLVSMITSTKNKYTRKFIDEIEIKIVESSTLPELLELHAYFCNQAIEGSSYRLSFPATLRTLHTILIAKIEILKKQ